MRFNPEAKRFYDRKKAKTNNVVAIKALAHKLGKGLLSHAERGQAI